MKKTNKTLIKEIKDLYYDGADEIKSQKYQRYFKTGPGEYAEGDIFLGLSYPDQGKIIKKYQEQLSLTDIEEFIESDIHEHRVFALGVMKYMYENGDDDAKKKIYEYYSTKTHRVNNWDLVDTSAGEIPGKYLQFKSRKPLYDLAKSDLLWDNRIAIIATFPYIRDLDFKDTFGIAEVLLHHEHDLIHKAVGWMIREVGNRDMAAEEKFLKKYYNEMPRTMLRYAIEKFPEDLRQDYLKGRI